MKRKSKVQFCCSLLEKKESFPKRDNLVWVRTAGQYGGGKLCRVAEAGAAVVGVDRRPGSPGARGGAGKQADRRRARRGGGVGRWWWGGGQG